MGLQDHDPGRKVTRKVAGPVTTPYRFVTTNAVARGVKVCDTQNQSVYGVIEQTTRNDGDLSSIVTAGIPWVEAGAAINDGDFVISDNQGRAIPDPATNAVTAEVAGKARGAATAAGQPVGIELFPHRVKR